MIINNLKLALIFLCSISCLNLFAKELSDFAFTDRAAWAQACKKLPMNIDQSENAVFRATKESAWSHHPKIGNDKKLAWQEFSKALMATLDLVKNDELANPALWIGDTPESSFYDTKEQVFNPYVQKLDCTTQDKVVLHGDFHGDIHSLVQELQDLEHKGFLEKGSFKLKNKKIKLIYLGDYVDRGIYGSEVIYTLLRLRLANPDQVIMVRGNHEDPRISNRYGFKDELIDTFGEDEEKYNQIYRLYNFLPIALYVGSNNNYLQCCHGGLEHGYKPQALLNGTGKFNLLGELQRANFEKHLDCHCHKDHTNCDGPWKKDRAAFKNFTPTSPTNSGHNIGFMWFDFIKSGQSIWTNRGLTANENLTQEVLAYQSEGSAKKVRGIIRAHQHDTDREESDPTNLMSELVASNGVYKLWRPIETNKKRSLTDGIAWTFNVAPDSIYGKDAHFGFAAYAVLSMANEYKDWKLKVHNVQIVHRPGYDKPQKK